MEILRRLVVVDHLDLSRRTRHCDRELCRRIDLAIKDLSHSLSAIHAWFPCIQKRWNMLRHPLYAERAACDEDYHHRLACSVYSFNQFLLKSHQVKG